MSLYNKELFMINKLYIKSQNNKELTTNHRVNLLVKKK